MASSTSTLVFSQPGHVPADNGVRLIAHHLLNRWLLGIHSSAMGQVPQKDQAYLWSLQPPHHWLQKRSECKGFCAQLQVEKTCLPMSSLKLYS